MDELARQFASLAERFGPTVANAALEAARMEAYSTLAGSVMWAGAAAAAVFAGRYFVRKAKADDNIDSGFVAFGGYALLGLGALLLAPAVWAWMDPWTWAAINHPELWLAKRAFKI